MLTLLFFISSFTSFSWLIYSLLYIHAQLAGNDFSSLPTTQMASYVALVILPMWIIWHIFGFIGQYFKGKSVDMRLNQLFTQMKKNQDYTDLIVRVMIDAEHEIKDGFVVNKFDVFIADMNEILADIAQRCNAVSSMQLEQLWLRIKNGERWTIAKTLVEASQKHEDFSGYLAEKARKDNVFKGTLMEFCARYQNLTALLEKHDRDRVFITMIETGVMGKVYSILAPVTDCLDNIPQIEPIVEEPEKDFEVSPRILTMESPEKQLTESVEEKTSLWQRVNPFKSKKSEEMIRNEPDIAKADDEEFFAALQKSMTSPEIGRQLGEGSFEPQETFEPRFNLQIAEPENDEPFLSAPVVETEQEIKPMTVDSDTEIKSEDNNFAYPFGGWIDEDNSQK